MTSRWIVFGLAGLLVGACSVLNPKATMAAGRLRRHDQRQSLPIQSYGALKHADRIAPTHSLDDSAYLIGSAPFGGSLLDLAAQTLKNLGSVSPPVRKAARDLRDGVVEVGVKTREDAEQLLYWMTSGLGFVNTTGLPGQFTKGHLQNGNAWTYHWDTQPDPQLSGKKGQLWLSGHGPNNPHGHTPHVQVHGEKGESMHIFFEWDEEISLPKKK